MVANDNNMQVPAILQSTRSAAAMALVAPVLQALSQTATVGLIDYIDCNDKWLHLDKDGG